GYKGGGINPRPFFAFNTFFPVLNGQINPAGPLTDVNQIKSFAPETLTEFEVGTKSELFERRVRLNTAAFYNLYKDIQLPLTLCPIAPCLLPANAGDAHVWGLELETEAHPLAGLEFDGSASYLHFKYVRLDPSVLSITRNMVTPYTPTWKWSAG